MKKNQVGIIHQIKKMNDKCIKYTVKHVIVIFYIPNTNCNSNCNAKCIFNYQLQIKSNNKTKITEFSQGYTKQKSSAGSF